MTALNKRVWGPAAWLFLHAAAATCDDPQRVRALLGSVAACLPCPECRADALAYLKRADVDGVVDKETAVAFVRSMHRSVNERLGKTDVSEEAFQKLYVARSARRGDAALRSGRRRSLDFDMEASTAAHRNRRRFWGAR